MVEKIPNFPFVGNKERYNIWEKEKFTLSSVLDGARKDLNCDPVESLQKIEGEITPEKSVDVDDRALQKKDCPNIIFGRPHAGEYVPADIWDCFAEEGKVTAAMIDRGTERIFRSEEIPSVGTKIARVFIDQNRPPLPGMRTKGSAAIGGVLWKKGLTGKLMYEQDKEPSDEDIRRFSERFYLPYYNSMMGTIGSVADRRENKKERILVVDGHSFMVSDNDFFKPVCEHYGIENLKELPLFIIGDLDGKSCDQDIRDLFEQSLQKNFDELNNEVKESLLKNSSSGKIVGVNEFMKGARNVDFFGQRSEGINAIQLEVNEGMFVDEVNRDYLNASYNYDNLKVVKRLIEKTCLDVNKFLKNK